MLAQFLSLDGLESLPVERAREVNDREARVMFGPVEDVGAISDDTIASGLRIRIYEPPAAARGTLVFFHGGGWVVGGFDSHDGVARFLCRHAGCAVVAVDYRLAPEHPFPAPLEDAWAATQWAGPRQPLAIGGDSSGGNLAAVVARKARDAGIEVALQLLVYPALDLRHDSHWIREYLAGHEAGDPDASPLCATDLEHVAPALILSCGPDPLRAQADQYEERLRHAGVPARHLVYPALIHGAYRMPGVLPEARAMLDDSATALRSAFGTS